MQNIISQDNFINVGMHLSSGIELNFSENAPAKITSDCVMQIEQIGCGEIGTSAIKSPVMDTDVQAISGQIGAELVIGGESTDQIA